MKTTTRDNAGVPFPPPLIYIGALLLGLRINKSLPIKLLPRSSSLLLGVPSIGLGVTILRSAFTEMRKAGTEVNPTKPTTSIVMSGPYQFTRNPLYLSMALLYGGISLLVNSFWVMALLPAVLFIINRNVIDREERYLAQKFGQEYLSYKARVRRWL